MTNVTVAPVRNAPVVNLPVGNTLPTLTMPHGTLAAASVDDTATFPTVFARNVAAHPHKPAIITPTTSLSYGELNERAHIIADMLLSQTSNEPQPIALLFPQEIAAFAATIGVLQSGNFYVALDPLYPPSRLAEILSDSTATILLCSDSSLALAHALCPDNVQIINVSRLHTTPRHANPHPLELPQIAPTAYAYLGYTSGSTGKAKGVIETHRNHICHWRNLMLQQPTYGNERVLFLNRLSFSGGQLAFYMTFLAGATLYLYDLQEDSLAELPAWIEAHQITVWNSVPTVFRAFVAQITEPQQVASIRLLRLASDTILGSDLEAYRQFFAPSCKLWFCYALTEAKTVTMAFLDQATTISPTEIPSGWPIDGMEIQIVDADGRPLGPHQVGEIVVRSRFVSPGYWRNTALSAERFHPDETRPGFYFLYTGDLGKVDETGCLYHKGRMDSQVKIRGYRVELREIEAHLATVTGVREAAVRTTPTASGDVRLDAYLVGSQDLPTSSQLRRLLEERLPAYMIPNSFTVIERMPVNRNGKVDRAALPEPDLRRIDRIESTAMPRTPLETTLAAIWERTLGLQPIGIHDNFFDLGGHSLLALNLCDQIADATGKHLPLSVVLTAPTIAAQSVLIAETDVDAAWSSLVAVQTGGTRPPLFCAPPAHGTALSFLKLAQFLDAEQPIYAFDPVGVDGITPPLESVEAMAAHYIAAMQTVQPHGPYRIGGKCMGGQVAFEMARQLLARGEQIDTLVILDSSAPANGPHWQWSPPDRTLGAYAQRLYKRIATRTLHVVLRNRWRQLKGRFSRRNPHWEALRKTHRLAQLHYTAQPIPQHLFIVQSEEYANKQAHQQQWAALTTVGLTCHAVPGSTHRSMLVENEEHISVLARYLQEHLHQLDRPTAPELSPCHS